MRTWPIMEFLRHNFKDALKTLLIKIFTISKSKPYRYSLPQYEIYELLNKLKNILNNYYRLN